MRFKPGDSRIGAGIPISYAESLVDGAIGSTPAAQLSSIATFGTTALDVFDKLIDPGYTMALKSCLVQLNPVFAGLNGSFVASIIWFVQARSEGYMVQSGGQWISANGDYCNLTGTLQTAGGTLLGVTPSLYGYVNVGSLPFAPVRVKITAVSTKAANCTAQVKAPSAITLIGNPIPGA